jgi:aspartyl aminopeptidase
MRSLYVGTRSSHPTGVSIAKSRKSSACSGTSDWMNSVERCGSSPAPSQSATISTVALGTSAVSMWSVRKCQSATKKKQSRLSCIFTQFSSAPR